MRALCSAVGDVNQEAVSKLLLNVGIPLLCVTVRIFQLRHIDATSEQDLRITGIASGGLRDSARERITDDRGWHTGVHWRQNRRTQTVNRIIIRAVIPSDIVGQPEHS